MRRYAALLSALRLAAGLMRLRLPTGKPNVVRTKAPLWTSGLPASRAPASPRTFLGVGTGLVKGYADGGGCIKMEMIA